MYTNTIMHLDLNKGVGGQKRVTSSDIGELYYYFGTRAPIINTTNNAISSIAYIHLSLVLLNLRLTLV